MSPLSFSFLGQQLQLLPEKCIWWEENKTLIISDLHIGKSAHFRKNGIPVPNIVHGTDLQLLAGLMDRFLPLEIIFLGDLFHSQSNEDVLDFKRFIFAYPNIRFRLVLGNHDILPLNVYEKMQLIVHESFLELDPFVFAHDAEGVSPPTGYLVTGHVHPMVLLEGKGRQSLRLPCFYFGKTHAILPAFGSFKGGATVSPKEGDFVFAVTKNKVHQL